MTTGYIKIETYLSITQFSPHTITAYSSLIK